MSPHTAAATEVTIALAIVKTLILVVGGSITYFALKAYRRTRRRELGLLTLGFGLVTLGFVLAGVLYEILEVTLETGILIESLLVLVGFGVIAYSLYVD
ncbi:hypothetical protein ACLI4U_05060 [Natrialbaceae archaeon A-CW2]|uniref:DUF7521 family protein n=1 Tax=Natronosalvus amylolyticus TaxID=2961994 RepID=UPI0020C9587E|nr:hypothetical protein [Natronosalvus amylolyticus]